MSKQKITETHIGVFEVLDDGTLKLNSSYGGDAEAIEEAEKNGVGRYVILPVRVQVEVVIRTSMTRTTIQNQQQKDKKGGNEK